MAVAFWNQWNEAKMRIWGNERNNCKMRLFLWNDPQIAWMRLKWSYHSRLIYIILEWLEWGSNERMKKILQNKTASQEWLPNCLNETEMRGMKEILGPESNFGGAKIEASYWPGAQNRGLWLVESRWFWKFKPSAFLQEIPVIPLISESFRCFWSHSWD